jgi:hypothetical protein
MGTVTNRRHNRAVTIPAVTIDPLSQLNRGRAGGNQQPQRNTPTLRTTKLAEIFLTRLQHLVRLPASSDRR